MRHSKTEERNPDVVDWTARYEKRGNLEFFADALKALATGGVGNGGVGVIGLLGQKDLPGVTLRMAQAMLRWDLRPSLWSHAFLIAAPARSRLRDTPVWEVTLHARDGEFPAPELNGVGESRLGHYDGPALDANVALLAVKMSDQEARQVIDRARQPNVDRIRYNFWEMLGVWQAYLWARGQRPNPLEGGVPIPASSYVEMAYEAIGLDLTPAASERNSAPEHLWNGAIWWHDAYRELRHPVSGFYVHRNKQCYLQDAAPPELPDYLGGTARRAPRSARKRGGR
jgi:hypothetical protein